MHEQQTQPTIDAEFEIFDEQPLGDEPQGSGLAIPEEARAVAVPEMPRAEDPVRTMTEIQRTEVKDGETQGRMIELVRAVRAFRKQIADTFDPVIAANHAAHKAAVAAKKTHDDTPAAMEALGKRKLADFDSLQERARQAARLEAERKAAEEAKARLEAEAKTIEATGDVEGAKAVRSERAVPIVSTPVAREVERGAGLSVRTTYDVEVFDLGLLVKAVAEGRAPLAYLLPNERALRSVAQASKGVLTIDGVKVIEKKSASVRAA